MIPYISLRLLLGVFLLGFVMNAQTYHLSSNDSCLQILGTSNIHDWIIEVKETEGILNVLFDDDILTQIENMEISVVSESLKSGKKDMDKNTYKALQTNAYKYISFHQTKMNSVERMSTNNYKVNTTGSLIVAGIKNEINLIFNLKVESDKLILDGEHKLNMTDYKINPPTALFGTIKTRKNVVVKFESHFRENVEP